jgi:hypothetical protein
MAAVRDRDGVRLLLQNLVGNCKNLWLIWLDSGYRTVLVAWVAKNSPFNCGLYHVSKGKKGWCG